DVRRSSRRYLYVGARWQIARARACSRYQGGVRVDLLVHHQHGASGAIAPRPRILDLRQRNGAGRDLEARGHDRVQQVGDRSDEAVAWDAADATAHELDR